MPRKRRSNPEHIDLLDELKALVAALEAEEKNIPPSLKRATRRARSVIFIVEYLRSLLRSCSESRIRKRGNRRVGEIPRDGVFDHPDTPWDEGPSDS